MKETLNKEIPFYFIFYTQDYDKYGYQDMLMAFLDINTAALFIDALLENKDFDGSTYITKPEDYVRTNFDICESKLLLTDVDIAKLLASDKLPVYLVYYTKDFAKFGYQDSLMGVIDSQAAPICINELLEKKDYGDSPYLLKPEDYVRSDFDVCVGKMVVTEADKHKLRLLGRDRPRMEPIIKPKVVMPDTPVKQTGGWLLTKLYDSLKGKFQASV